MKTGIVKSTGCRREATVRDTRCRASLTQGQTEHIMTRRVGAPQGVSSLMY